MSIADTPRTMTAEELLAMPDDGVERWLIRGELRENWAADASLRTPAHGRTTANVGVFLKTWIRTQRSPRGNAYTGTWFKLRANADTLVGLDLAYISPELESRVPRGKGVKVIEGVPLLVAEVLSPSDRHEDVTERVQEFLDVGVAIVWVLDPDFETVGVFRPGHQPQYFNRDEELTADPHLPGLRVRVAELFE